MADSPAVDILVLDQPLPVETPDREAPDDWPPRFHALRLAAVRTGEPPPAASREVARRTRYPVGRIRFLQGVDWLLTVECDVANLSLGPAARGPFDPEDPLHVATRALYDRGIPVIVAAGNDGREGGATLQELARAPWVIAVGATDAEGRLLDTSSRGAAGGPAPTVVSDGTHPEEPVPGTSFAAPNVAHAALFARKCLEYLIESANWVRSSSPDSSGPAIHLPWLGILDTGWDPKKAPYRWGPLARSIIESGSDAVQISLLPEERLWLRRVLAALGVGIRDFDFDAGPETIRRALVAMARPVAGEPHEVGAGAVTVDDAVAFFGDLTPSLLARVLLPEDEVAAETLPTLDEQLGSLWSEPKVAVLVDFFASGVRLSVSRVL